MTRRALAAVALCAVAAVALPPVAHGVRGYSRREPASTPDRARPGEAGQAEQVDPTPVRLATLRRGTLTVPVVATGVATAPQVAVVAPFDGRVTHVRVRDGTAVRRGAVLVQLDSTEAALDLAHALAAQRQAELHYRELTAYDGRVADESTRVMRAAAASVRSGREAAAVAVARRALALRRTSLRAPLAGRAADVRAHVGQVVRAGDELLTVVARGPLRVELELLETRGAGVARGRRATVTFAALPGHRFDGSVAELNPRVDPESRSRRVVLRVDDPRGIVLPGMFARASIDGPAYHQRLLVPRAAVLERDQRALIFTYEPRASALGRARWRYVTVGVGNDSLVEVSPTTPSEALEVGAAVIVDGHATLTHGAPVRDAGAPRGTSDAPPPRR